MKIYFYVLCKRVRNAILFEVNLYNFFKNLLMYKMAIISSINSFQCAALVFSVFNVL